MEPSQEDHLPKLLFPFLFVCARFIMLMGFSLDGLKGYGDFWNYLPIAKLGMPYFDIWVEYPPVFPFISRFVAIVSQNQHAYEYLLIILFSVVQAFNIYLFLLIAKKINLTDVKVSIIGFGYTILSLVLPFTWWTFDVLCLLMILVTIYLFLDQKYAWSGVAVGIGFLIKLFPILLFVLPVKFLSFRKAIGFLTSAILLPLTVYCWLLIASPEYTKASIASQFVKGSWESVWALVDGNLTTGNFSENIDHRNADTAYTPTGNPAKIPSLVTLPVFGLLGFLAVRRLSNSPTQSTIPIVGLTFSIFFLWSPGWSPQWSTYLLPLFLLGLPTRLGLLCALTFLTINLLEWPVLLSRGRFDLIWLTILIRTLLLIIYSGLFYTSGLEPKVIENKSPQELMEI